MLSRLKNNFDIFINSYQFAGITFFISALFYVFNLQIITFITVIVFGCYIFLSQKDVTPVFPLVMAFTIGVKDFSVFDNLTFLLLAFIPVLASIILHFVFYCKSFSFGSLALPLYFVSISALLGGFLSPYMTTVTEGLSYLLVSSIIPLVLYLLFVNTISDNDKMNKKEYLSYSLIFLAIAVSFEIIAVLYNLCYNNNVDYVSTGWFNSGFAGYFFHFAIAGCCYLITVKKIISPYFFCVVSFIVILFIAENDATFGISCIACPIYLFFINKSIRKKQKNKFLLLTLICIIAIYIAFIILTSLPDFEDYFSYHFLYDTGRSEIYRDGIHLFTDAPIFGSGFGSVFHINNHHTDISGYMHSTLLQVLCSLGIVGLVAYIIYFVFRIKIFTKHNIPFNVFMFIAFLSYQTVAMIDNAEFSFLTVFITVLTAVIEYENKDNPKAELPLQYYA